jgi:hypothetical protein
MFRGDAMALVSNEDGNGVTTLVVELDHVE